MATKATNLGRMVNFLSGFQGVAAGSVATINPPVNQRFHRLVLNCSAQTIYTAPTVTLRLLSGALSPGIQPQILFTITAGVLSAPTIAYAGLGLTNGTYITNTAGTAGYAILADPTGYGQSVTITVAGNVVTVAAITAGATVPLIGPVSPATMITSLRQLVNGVVIRDITPAQILAIEVASGYLPQAGCLPIWFTEPQRNILRDNELTSWDLAGQSTYQLQIGIAAGIISPTLTGAMEFDFNRNARPVKNTAQLASAIAAGLLPAGTTLASNPRVPVLQPVAQHAFGVPIPAGRFDITTLPWNNPQTRLWLSGSLPGNIYQVEVMCDGSMIYQATSQQMFELAGQYGFQLGDTDTSPTAGGGTGNGSTGNNISGTANPLFVTPTSEVQVTVPNGTLAGAPWLVGANGFPLDGAVLFDADNRPWKACRTKQSFILRVYSNVAQNLTILQETLPGAFSG
jgi:hypothetical protein